ncbi:MAG: arabinofuranosidase catalytic domain-containing protein, partial [Trebonia sp.]
MNVNAIKRRFALVVGAAVLVVGGFAGSALAASSATQPASGQSQAQTGVPRPGGAQARPCDIYAAGRTPCVAAYSTVRALYRNYRGPLYRVTRASDGANTDIGVRRPGGYADAARQDAFCAGTVCTISRIYDQSPEHNDLGIEPIGGNGSADVGAIANALPVVVDGHHVYGVSVQAGVGYRNDVTRGVPTGSQPQ